MLNAWSIFRSYSPEKSHLLFFGGFATFEQQLIVSEENNVDTLEEHNGRKQLL